MMKKNKKLKFWLLGIAAFLIAVVFCLWPTQYYIEAPGEAFQISKYVKSTRKPNPNFYLVTVSERPAVMIDYLTSFFRAGDSRYSKTELMGTSSSAEYNQMQQYYMETSQNNAIYYAANKAKVPYRQEFLGVYVMEVMKNSTFKNKLKVGDILVSVNGRKFSSSQDLIKYVSSLKHKKVQIAVIRGKKHLTFSGKTVKLSGTNRYGIGIQLVDHTKVVTDPAVKIDAGDIGGPSAGLMFTLECYQLFTGKNLSAKKIAGTGTIDSDGKVGMIGGVDKKVIAASRQGMRVFFAPTDQPEGVKKNETNYAKAVRTAKKIHTKMKIVPVAHFEDALNYLEK